MQLIPIIVSIIIITIVVLQKKKKSREKKQASSNNVPITAQIGNLEIYFEDRIKYIIESYSSNPSHFEAYYHKHMASKISKEKDLLLDKLPTVKEKYKIALHKLADISKDNTVFFTTEEEAKSILGTERDKRMSTDIIKTLPLLADFAQIYREMSEIYEYADEIHEHNSILWGGLSAVNYENEANETVREYQKKRFDAACDSLWRGYDYFIKELGWQIMCEVHPELNTKENKSLFETVAGKDSCSHAWIQVWFNQFQAIAKKDPRSMAIVEIISFMNDLEKEIDSPAWVSSRSGIFFSPYSAFPILFDLKNYTKDDLMEIRDLYISGKMTGRYYKTNDPRHSNNKNEGGES